MFFGHYSLNNTYNLNQFLKQKIYLKKWKVIILSMDNIITHSLNFGALITTMGLFGELRHNKDNFSRCLITNGNVGLGLIMLGTSVKIYRDITH